MQGSAALMRVCLIYDCLYPWTVGGGERWYASLARRLADAGHEVTYLTLRQWDRDDPPQLPGMAVRAVGPRMSLYVDGRRRILPPLVFGAGVLWHLLRHRRRYDVVHCAAFPYFSLLAAGLLRRRLVVDWFEVWSDDYWRDYLGPVGGRVGALVQRACIRLPQRAFCLSRLHARRLREQGMRREPTILRGLYDGEAIAERGAREPLVVFAGRLIPEKRAPLGAAGVALAARRIDGLRAVFYGDGPQMDELRDTAPDVVSTPGFVEAAEVSAALSRALCLLLPSRREGYGLVVVEAAAHGTPSIVVADVDNAATELVADGVNGIVVQQADAESIARAIERAHALGEDLRISTRAWFAEHRHELSLERSLEIVAEAYAAA